MSGSLPDISIRQLEYLVAVADAPTWAMAAGAVGVSPSALSQGLAELERRVGVELFEPHGRRRVLRSSAVPVLDHARRVVGLTRDLVAWSERMRSAGTGRVRLGMIDIAATVHFPDVLHRFRHDHPGVQLTLSVAPSGSLLDGLRDGELDLAVCVEPPDRPPGIEMAPLLEEPLVIMLPEGDTVGPPVSWGPWLLFPGGSHSRQRIEERLREVGAPLRVAAESHQPDVLVQMVVLGLGWTVLPVTPDAPRAGLVLGPELVRRRLVLARRVGSVVDPAVDVLAARLGGG